MTLQELMFVLLIAIVLVSTGTGRYLQSRAALNEVVALQSVYQAIRTALLERCEDIYGKRYSSLKSFRSAARWREPISSKVTSNDWAIEVGKRPATEFIRIRVRYPDMAFARVVADKLSPYSHTTVRNLWRGPTLFWHVALTDSMPLHSNGLLDYGTSAAFSC